VANDTGLGRTHTVRWDPPMARDQAQEIEVLIRARYPIIYVVSWEEDRVESALRQVASGRRKELFIWTTTNGLVLDGRQPRNDGTTDPLAAMDEIMKSGESAVFIFKDFHRFLKDDAKVVRKLRDLAYDLKRSYKTVVLLCPVLELPPELEKEITVVDYALPTAEEIAQQITQTADRASEDKRLSCHLDEAQMEEVVKAAQGLTAVEIDNVLMKSLVEKQCFDVPIILAEKEQIIRKSGILEYFHTEETIEDVGGLDVLKQWLTKRRSAFTEAARAYGLPQPKGLLLIGVQGCGKSLTAKAVADLWSLPLLRLDVGRIFAGIVGSSEERMRRAIATAESIAPVVLWLDEVEKGFAGTQSSAFSDAGTTSRVFGSFITWLQEKNSPVFVMATANDITNLPPELLRKGRFDEIFFIDLPSEDEREHILRIHVGKRLHEGRSLDEFNIAALSQEAGGFSGAEIEQAVVAAMYEAFAEESRPFTTDDILRAVRETFPLSATMREKIAELREWAENRARPASSEVSEGLPTRYGGGEAAPPAWLRRRRSSTISGGRP
jgi:SpoVK/Ycf46/Vps4 family AAA+-type ATPase